MNVSSILSRLSRVSRDLELQISYRGRPVYTATPRTAPADAFEAPKRRNGPDLGGTPPSNLQADAAYVTSLYQSLLGRAPDAEGMKNHLAGLARGMSRAELRQVFLDSPEYAEKQRPQPAPAPQPTPPPISIAQPPVVVQPKAPVTNEEWRSFFMDLVAKKGVGGAATQKALAALEPELAAQGAVLQRSSAGEIRGRIYLPTGDANDPWGRAVDVVNGWGTPWQWLVR